MRIDRLFHVLVVHGSLLVAGCDQHGGPGEDGASAEDDGSGDDGNGTSSTTDPTNSTATSDATEDAADGPVSTDDGPAPTTDGPASTTDGPASTTDDPGSESSSSGDAPVLNCSSPAAPDDTCGCPCCWVADGCLNTDECCAVFTELCTDPV